MALDKSGGEVEAAADQLELLYQAVHLLLGLLVKGLALRQAFFLFLRLQSLDQIAEHFIEGPLAVAGLKVPDSFFCQSVGNAHSPQLLLVHLCVVPDSGSALPHAIAVLGEFSLYVLHLVAARVEQNLDPVVHLLDESV